MRTPRAKIGIQEYNRLIGGISYERVYSHLNVILNTLALIKASVYCIEM